MSWQPTATIEQLKARAELLKSVRAFFLARDVLEVETPLLCYTSVTDPYIHSIQTSDGYLQTSPEYAMKRLLAAGSGSIYQLCKAFRKNDKGQHHNPEFTMLEWYRVGFNHHQLMDEVDALLQTLLKTSAGQRISYLALFQKYLNINPHTATLAELHEIAKQQSLHVESSISDCTTWLQLLMSHCIEPQIGEDVPVFIYDFPVAQAALAKIIQSELPVAARFEVFYRGLELANGFHELQNANEQRQRFENNLAMRKELGLESLPIDEHFLAALEHGLPDCSGVALGFDRVVMLATDCAKISEVISFD